MSVADSVRAAAEAAMKDAERKTLEAAGMVYDQNYGMYYDYNSGYYYDAVRDLQNFIHHVTFLCMYLSMIKTSMQGSPVIARNYWINFFLVWHQ